MIKLQIHTVKDTVTACLLFVAVCAPLGVVRIITPELPAEEAIGQWVWFGKSSLTFKYLYSHCKFIATDGGKIPGSMYCVSPISLFACRGDSCCVVLLRLLEDYVSCMVLPLPVIRVMRLQALSSIRDRMRGIWQWYCLFVCICIYVFLKIKQLFIIWKRG